MPIPVERVSKLLAAALAATVLGAAVVRGFATTSAETRSHDIAVWRSFADQEECIYHSIRASVPKGAKVFVVGASRPQVQMLAELSTGWAVPQAQVRSAEWTIGVVAGQLCGGLELRAQRL